MRAQGGGGCLAWRPPERWPERPVVSTPAPTVLVFAPRERTRALAREAFPRRRWRLLVTRTVDDTPRAFRDELIDAALIDIGSAQEENWRAAAYAREFPSVPFFALTTLRATDGPALAQCATLEFADVLVEDVDEEVMRELVLRQAFSTRFARALIIPPPPLGLTTGVQLDAWQYVIQYAGRPVRTAALAESLGVTREHMSRSFFGGGRAQSQTRDRSRAIDCRGRAGL